uniref:Uncharacterized protein n=1 Tax=Anguilla anguilla TaxID=7936 RepID=A0A0E9W1Z1_ANGAN
MVAYQVLGMQLQVKLLQVVSQGA